MLTRNARETDEQDMKNTQNIATSITTTTGALPNCFVIIYLPVPTAANI